MSFPRYPSYKDSGVEWLWEVPEHWEVLPCRAIVHERTAKNEGAACTDYLSLMANVGVIPYAEKGDVGNKKPEDVSKCKLVTRGDFVINSMNYGIGSYGLSDYDGVCSPVYIVLKPQNDVVESRFAFRIFENRSFQTYAQSFGNGILEHRCAINWDILKPIGVCVPPMVEQKAILAFLDRETAKIDELVAEQRRLMELLKEKRQAVISHAVTQGLNPDAPMKPSGIEWLGDVPAHWEVVQFKQFVDIQNGSDHKHVEQIEGYPVLGSGGVFTYASEFLYDGESVLLGRKGTIDKPLHIIGRFWTVDTMYWTKISPDVSGKFTYYLALTIPFDFYSTNTALPSMTKGALSSHRVAFPPLPEQTQIAAFLDRETAKLDTLTAEAQRAIDLLQERRTALISAAVTGQIDVRQLTEEQTA